jgi:hypothetical protein
MDFLEQGETYFLKQQEIFVLLIYTQLHIKITFFLRMEVYKKPPKLNADPEFKYSNP